MGIPYFCFRTDCRYSPNGLNDALIMCTPQKNKKSNFSLEYCQILKLKKSQYMYIVKACLQALSVCLSV